MNKIEKLLNILVCQSCSHPLEKADNKLLCQHCQSKFQYDESRIFISKSENYNPESSDKLIFKIKLFFKQFPFLYKLLCYFFGAPTIGESSNKFLKQFSDSNVILNIGSGVKNIRADVINVDIYPYQNVNLIADANKLPIKNSSIDAIVCESLIEHLINPPVVVSELYRILKPSGKIYLVAPFILSFHSSPNDFYRWTDQGLSLLLLNAGFKDIKVETSYGPTSSLANILSEWLAILFSFNSQTIHNFLYIIFYTILSPFKFLDFILAKFKNAKNSALGFTVTAVK